MECEFNRTPYKRRLDNYSRHKHLTASMQLRKYSKDTFNMEFERTRKHLQKYSETCSTRLWRARELVRPRSMGLRTCQVTWPITQLFRPNFYMTSLQWRIIFIIMVSANSWHFMMHVRTVVKIMTEPIFFEIYTPHTWAMVVLSDMSSYMAHNLIIRFKFLYDVITMTNYIRHNCSSQFMMFHAAC
jgi:hypothetical protein